MAEGVLSGLQICARLVGLLREPEGMLLTKSEVARRLGLHRTTVSALLVPTGMVAPFAGATAPGGWLFCYGQAVSRSTYSILFSAVGTTYGSGDGSTTFNLPDLRGRSVFGLDNMGGSDAGRLSASNALGGGGGSETLSGSSDGHVLTVGELPAHSHTITKDSSGFGTGGGHAPANDGTGGTYSTSSVGSGNAHSHTLTGLATMPPYMLLNYVIKT